MNKPDKSLKRLKEIPTQQSKERKIITFFDKIRIIKIKI